MDAPGINVEDTKVMTDPMSTQIAGSEVTAYLRDRFVPSKDLEDLRTSYHLMEGGGDGPSTPPKSKIVLSPSKVSTRCRGKLTIL